MKFDNISWKDLGQVFLYIVGIVAAAWAFIAFLTFCIITDQAWS